MRHTRLRVLMVESGGWGGIGHYAHNLCDALSAAGVDVHLLSGSPYELDKLPRAFSLDVAIHPDQSYGEKAKALIERVRTLKPDLVHIQSTFSARKDALLWSILKLMRVPLVYTAHNVLPHDLRERNASGMNASYDLLYALSDRIIVHGQNIRDELYSRFRPDPAKISVIPHGDYSFAGAGEALSKEKARELLGLPIDRPTILAFGAIRDYKGIPELIDALPEIASRIPDVVCVVAGKPVGVDVTEYVNRARALGVEDHFILHAAYIPFERIHAYFESADVAAFPYRNIAQSGALQLAYAFARPVVATAVGALPETVRHGVNGYLVPPGDGPALVDALARVLGMSQADRKAMGDQSLELAKQEHSWPDAARATVELYTGLLAS